MFNEDSVTGLRVSRLFLVFLVFLFSSASAQQYNSTQLPSVLWSQYSGAWSRLKGILEPPSSWDMNDYSSYSFVGGQPQTEQTIRAIDFNPKTNQVYWCDTSRRTLSRQSWSGVADWTPGGITTFLKESNMSISGLAVDWLTGNVYVTEQNQRAVLVTNDDLPSAESRYSVIAQGSIEHPKAIAVDPYLGLVFWSDVGDRSLGIYSSSMTGEGLRMILSTGLKPVGLDVDRDSRTLYWVEQATSSVYRCDYDGSNQVKLYSGSTADSNRAIALSSDYIFIVAESLLELYVHSKSSGDLLYHFDIDAFPYDVTVPTVLPNTPKHECDTMQCSHFCINLGNGKGVCTCSKGYYLGIDGKTCESGSPRYIYTIGPAGSSGVLIVNATLDVTSATLTQGLITSDVIKAQAVDADYRTRFIHVSDTGRGSLYRIDDTGNQMRELTVQQPNILGIAVHWVDSTVYWTDSVLGHVMAFKPDGRYHRIVMRGLTQPLGLSLDAANGLLYWSQGANQSGIYRSSLDGSSRELFYSSGNSVYQQLTVDLRSERLYFSEPSSRKLWWINLVTKQVNIALSSNNWNNLYGVTVFSDYLTWTEGGKDLQFAGQSSNRTLTTQPKAPYYPVSHAESYDVVTYGSYLQPDVTNVCGGDNGGCEQHCHSVSGGSRCSCAIGYQQDGKKCNTQLNKENVLFFTDPYHKQVYQISPNSSQLPINVNGVKLSLMEFPESFEIESSRGRIYWIDSFTKQIKSSDLNGKNEKVLLDIVTGSTPRRLAVHSSSRLVYYTDFSRGAIYRLNADTGDDHQVVYNNIYRPFALCVDQTNDLLYWTDGSALRVGRTSGERMNDLAQNIGNVTSLDLRPTDKQLYASDINGGRIIEFNLTTGDQRILFTSSGLQIYAVASSQQYIYFTAWNYKGIYRVDRSIVTTSQPELVVDPVFARLTDLRYVELIVMPVAALPVGLIAGAAVGGLLFLLLLLLLLLLAALLYRRWKSRKLDGDSPPENRAGETGTLTNRTSTTLLTDSSLSAPDQDASYATIVDEVAPRALLARPPGNGMGTLLPTNERRRPALGTMMGGGSDLPVDPPSLQHAGGESGGDVPDSEGLGSGAPGGYGEGLGSGAPGGYGEGVYSGLVGAGENALAAEAAALGAQKSQNYARKPVPASSGAHIKNTPIPAGFTLNAKGKQATFIQRMATKLRGGISSIRFSGGRLSWAEDPPSPTPGEAKQGLEGTTEIQSVDQVSQAKEPQKAAPTPGLWGLFTPPKLHEPPRGCKPASPFVPVQVKTS